MKNIISRLIPEKHKVNHKVYQSVISIIITDLLLILFAFFCIPIFYFSGLTIPLYLIIYLIPSSIFHISLICIVDDLRIPTAYFIGQNLLLIVGIMAFSGGLLSPFAILLFAVPPSIFLFVKKHIAKVWTAFILLIPVAFFVLEIAGVYVPEPLSEKGSYLIIPVVFLFGIVMISSIIIFFKDSLKQVRRKLNTANANLEVSNEELERFAYIASHDLKSPLRSISNFTHLIGKKYGSELDANGQEFLEIVKNNAVRMNQLIDDILTYSQSKNHELKQEEIDLNELIGSLKADLVSIDQFPDAKISINGELPIVLTDYTLLKQIFQNLIQNGLKYNKSGLKEVVVSYKHQEGKVIFKVKDNGIGMEPQYFEKIFEMFQRLHNKEEFQGTGIGLGICKKNIEQLGGQIKVESIVGIGTIFTLTFSENILEPVAQL